MSTNKNELSINISNAKDISIKDIHQSLSDEERSGLKKELEEMLALLRISQQERALLLTKLEEAKTAVDTNKPKSQIGKLLSGAGDLLKDIAKEAGKTAISALIRGGV